MKGLKAWCERPPDPRLLGLEWARRRAVFGDRDSRGQDVPIPAVIHDVCLGLWLLTLHVSWHREGFFRG